MASIDYAAEIRALRATYDSVAAVSDVESMKKQIVVLSEQAAAPDLWDNPDEAQKVTSQLSHQQSKLDRLRKISGRIDDLEVMVELAEEEDDQDTRDAAAEELESIRKALSELEIQTLLAGEYDEREAVVTIRSGAGGVDAADFAEILMRMYLR